MSPAGPPRQTAGSQGAACGALGLPASLPAAPQCPPPHAPSPGAPRPATAFTTTASTAYTTPQPIALSSHDQACPPSAALSSWRLQSERYMSSYWRWWTSRSCWPLPSSRILTGAAARYTTATSAGANDTRWLATGNHSVACPAGGLLQRWRVFTPPYKAGNPPQPMAIEYWCLKMTGSLSCSTQFTPPAPANASLLYLDRYGAAAAGPSLGVGTAGPHAFGFASRAGALGSSSGFRAPGLPTPAVRLLAGGCAPCGV
jgi:hypothetical protein